MLVFCYPLVCLGAIGFMSKRSSSVSSHRWEQVTDDLSRVPGGERRDPWEVPRVASRDADDSDDDGFDELDVGYFGSSSDGGTDAGVERTPAQCANEFLELLMDSYIQGTCHSARTFCVLCYVCNQASASRIVYTMTVPN